MRMAKNQPVIKIAEVNHTGDFRTRTKELKACMPIAPVKYAAALSPI